MRRVYIRERSAYTPSELADKLKPEDGGFRHWDADECIAKLLKRGVLSAGSIIDDEDSSTVKYDKYQFRWVGLAVYQDLVIVVYPKYFRGKDLPTCRRWPVSCASSVKPSPKAHKSACWPMTTIGHAIRWPS